jgi:hypothetical protein
MNTFAATSVVTNGRQLAGWTPVMSAVATAGWVPLLGGAVKLQGMTYSRPRSILHNPLQANPAVSQKRLVRAAEGAVQELSI